MEHCSGYSLSYLKLQFQNPYLNIENPSGKLIVRNGRAAPLLCSYGEFKLRPTRGLTFHSPSVTDIEGYMLTAFATGLSLQYCRLMDVRVLWSACRAEHPSGFSQSSVVVENYWILFLYNLDRKNLVVTLHEFCGGLAVGAPHEHASSKAK